MIAVRSCFIHGGGIIGGYVTALIAMFVVLIALLRAAPLWGVVRALPDPAWAGNDWWSHEHLAQAVLRGDWLLLQGRPLGEALPFSTQPLYPYVLALMHALTGSGLWGVYLLQQLLLGVLVWALSDIARRVYGATAGWIAALLTLGWLGMAQIGVGPAHVEHTLMTEALFLPLLALWLRALVGAPRWIPRRPWLVGVLGGLTCLARSPVLLAVPVILWPLLWPRRAKIAMLAGLLAVVLLATGRNLVAAHQLVLISDAGGVNFYMAQEPWCQRVAAQIRDAEYRWPWKPLGLGIHPARALECAWRDPARVLTGAGVRGLIVLGLAETSLPSAMIRLVWLLAALGLWRHGLTRATAAPVTVALTHAAVLVVMGYFTYGYRLVDPVLLGLIPAASSALIRA